MAEQFVIRDTDPVVAPRGQSPAAASRHDRPPEDEHWHLYEANPVPWWIALMWLSFFAFGVMYLVVSLVE